MALASYPVAGREGEPRRIKPRLTLLPSFKTSTSPLEDNIATDLRAQLLHGGEREARNTKAQNLFDRFFPNFAGDPKSQEFLATLMNDGALEDTQLACFQTIATQRLQETPRQRQKRLAKASTAVSVSPTTKNGSTREEPHITFD